MHNVWLIARREYIERIRTRGFLITTVLFPLIMGGLFYGSDFLGTRSNPGTHIAVVSSDIQLALDLQTELQQHLENDQANGSQPNSSGQSRIAVNIMDPGARNEGATREILNQELGSGDLDGYLWIASAPISSSRSTLPGTRDNSGDNSRGEDRLTFTFTPRSSQQDSLRGPLAAALGTVLMRERLAHRGIIASDADSLLQPVDLVVAAAPHRQDRESAKIGVGILFFLMYFVIMLYGMNVARAIIEEKTSRIIEIMLATIRPEEMMAGKIVGVGSVGLTQVGIWLVAALLLAQSTSALNLGGQSIHIALTASQVVYFFVYFILGYAFYSSIAAAFGAMTNTEQELQQLNMFLVLPLVVCFIPLATVMATPDRGISRILALIPPFTPLLMYLRVSLGHPAAWEIALSITLMLASIYAIVWVSSRIYRVGVLMYGKRPSLREVLRWLKYS